MVDVRSHWNNPLDTALLGRWQSMVIAEKRGNTVTQAAFRRDAAPMQIVSGHIGRHRVHYEAPPSSPVDDEMARFLDWYNTTRPSEDAADALAGLIRAGIAHVWFEMVRPFDDGNERVGRAIVDHAISFLIRNKVIYLECKRG